MKLAYLALLNCVVAVRNRKERLVSVVFYCRFLIKMFSATFTEGMLPIGNMISS